VWLRGLFTAVPNREFSFGFGSALDTPEPVSAPSSSSPLTATATVSSSSSLSEEFSFGFALDGDASIPSVADTSVSAAASVASSKKQGSASELRSARFVPTLVPLPAPISLKPLVDMDALMGSLSGSFAPQFMRSNKPADVEELWKRVREEVSEDTRRKSRAARRKANVSRAAQARKQSQFSRIQGSKTTAAD
jgi:hypothetical protein